MPDMTSELDTSAESEAITTDAAAPAPVVVADEVLLAAVDMARAALLDFTPADTIGRVIGHVAEEEHVVTLWFECRLAGYPGWHWTVSLSRIGDETKPTVLESELMPGESALLAPEWVPWSERLAEYQASKLAHDDDDDHDDDEHDDESDDDSDDELDDDEHDDDDDEDDEDEDDSFDDDYVGNDVQQKSHAGDIDGLEIDHLADELSDVAEVAEVEARD